MHTKRVVWTDSVWSVVESFWRPRIVIRRILDAVDGDRDVVFAAIRIKVILLLLGLVVNIPLYRIGRLDWSGVGFIGSVLMIGLLRTFVVAGSVMVAAYLHRVSVRFSEVLLSCVVMLGPYEFMQQILDYPSAIRTLFVLSAGERPDTLSSVAKRLYDAASSPSYFEVSLYTDTLSPILACLSFVFSYKLALNIAERCSAPSWRVCAACAAGLYGVAFLPNYMLGLARTLLSYSFVN